MKMEMLLYPLHNMEVYVNYVIYGLLSGRYDLKGLCFAPQSIGISSKHNVNLRLSSRQLTSSNYL